jgi:hypothetical protein
MTVFFMANGIIGVRNRGVNPTRGSNAESRRRQMLMDQRGIAIAFV